MTLTPVAQRQPQTEPDPSVRPPLGAMSGFAPASLRPSPLVADGRTERDLGTESSERPDGSHYGGVCRRGGLPPSGDLT